MKDCEGKEEIKQHQEEGTDMMISPKLFREYLERLSLFKQFDDEHPERKELEYFTFSNEAVAIFQSSTENYLKTLSTSALMASQFRGGELVQVKDLQFILSMWSSAFDYEVSRRFD